MTEKELAEQLLTDYGATLYRVGGCVRDKVMGVNPKDIDYVVTGYSMDIVNCKLLTPIKGTNAPVFKVSVNGVYNDLTLGRKDKSIGKKYGDFNYEIGGHIYIEDDLFRRDFKMNAMAEEVMTDMIVDPFGGVKDIQSKIIDIVSPAHFGEDPVRVLRLARFTSDFGFTPSFDAKHIATENLNNLLEISKERMVKELRKSKYIKKFLEELFKIDSGMLGFSKLYQHIPDFKTVNHEYNIPIILSHCSDKEFYGLINYISTKEKSIGRKLMLISDQINDKKLIEVFTSPVGKNICEILLHVTGIDYSGMYDFATRERSMIMIPDYIKDVLRKEYIIQYIFDKWRDK